MPLLKPPRGIQLNRSHPLARGLVGVWLMNEGGGNKVYDLSGNAKHGTFVGDTKWDVGKYGKCLSFDGTGDYVTLDSRGFGLTTALTISAWIKADVWNQDRDVYSGPSLDFNFGHQNANNWWLYLYGPGGNVSYDVSGLNTSLWYHFVGTWDGSIAKLYINGVNVASANATGTLTGGTGTRYIGAWRNDYEYWDGLIDHLMIYNRGLSAAEIQQLYREPFAMFEQAAVEKLLYTAAGVIWLAGSAGVQSATSATVKQLRCIVGLASSQSQVSVLLSRTLTLGGSANSVAALSALCKIIRKVSGITASASDVTGLLKAILHITASVGGIAAVDGMVTLRGEILLSGTVTGTAFLYGTLMSLAPQSWFSSSLEIERQWIREALFNGISANAFKLGTALTVGWFWVRVSGCSALYRGAGMEQIDFTNILAIAAQDARDIRPPSYLLHNSNSTYFYVVRHFNNCGYRECTLSAAVGLSIDAGGELAKPLPNNIFCSKTEQMDGNKIRLVWFYCPVGQKSKPEHFKIYWDGRTGQVDYDNPVATINYQGRKYYNYETVTLEPGRYLFAIRAEDAYGIENSSLSQLKIDMCTDTPDSISILSAETV